MTFNGFIYSKTSKSILQFSDILGSSIYFFQGLYIKTTEKPLYTFIYLKQFWSVFKINFVILKVLKCPYISVYSTELTADSAVCISLLEQIELYSVKNKTFLQIHKLHIPFSSAYYISNLLRKKYIVKEKERLQSMRSYLPMRYWQLVR